MKTFEIAHVSPGHLEVAPSLLPAGITSLDVEIVRPGDRVRLTNVLDAVQPAAKVGSPEASFPGILGPAGKAGLGRTLVLDDVAVISTCDFSATHALEALPDRPDGVSMVDMAGPGAPFSPWAATANVVLSFTADPAVSLEDADRAIRGHTIRVAAELAGAHRETTPDLIEYFPDPGEAAAGLPVVTAVVFIGAEGPLLDTFLYGKSLRSAKPRLLRGAEMLDGALTSGHYDWAALRNPTFVYQRSRLVKRLFEDHARTLRFGGVIVARAYMTTYELKRSNARSIARLAASAGAAGAIISTFQSGNSQTDTMLAVEACEDLGIRTTGIISETDHGLTDHVGAADSLVSVGNEDDTVPPWTPDRILGGASGIPSGPEPVAVLAYLGAMSQMGDSRFTAVVP